MNWLYNHGRRQSIKNDFKSLANWNFRSVVCEIFKTDIQEMLEDAGRPGTREWLAAYQPKVTELIKSMSREQRQEVETAVEEWNARGPNTAVQRRSV